MDWWSTVLAWWLLTWSWSVWRMRLLCRLVGLGCVSVCLLYLFDQALINSCRVNTEWAR